MYPFITYKINAVGWSHNLQKFAAYSTWPCNCVVFA